MCVGGAQIHEKVWQDVLGCVMSPLLPNDKLMLFLKRHLALLVAGFAVRVCWKPLLVIFSFSLRTQLPILRCNLVLSNNGSFTLFPKAPSLWDGFGRGVGDFVVWHCSGQF